MHSTPLSAPLVRFYLDSDPAGWNNVLAPIGVFKPVTTTGPNADPRHILYRESLIPWECVGARLLAIV